MIRAFRAHCHLQDMLVHPQIIAKEAMLGPSIRMAISIADRCAFSTGFSTSNPKTFSASPTMRNIVEWISQCADTRLVVLIAD